MEDRREEIWLEILGRYPETYDGKVLILDDFRLIENIANFRLSFMRFSRVQTLVRMKQKAPGYGVLGFQAIIFSKKKDHVLAGVRSENSQYCPLFHTVPGGILEIKDAEGSFEDACMREVNEEINVDLVLEKHLVALMSELHGTVGVVAIISGQVSNEVEINDHLEGNDEWLNSEVSWYDVDSLSHILPENSLQGLLFVKEERNRYTRTKESVLWP